MHQSGEHFRQYKKIVHRRLGIYGQIREVLLISENKFDVCQFCGKKFDREETLAVDVIEEHDSLIGSDDNEE
jgi:hypothetical protein